MKIYGVALISPKKRKQAKRISTKILVLISPVFYRAEFIGPYFEGKTSSVAREEALKARKRIKTSKAPGPYDISTIVTRTLFKDFPDIVAVVIM